MCSRVQVGQHVLVKYVYGWTARFSLVIRVKGYSVLDSSSALAGGRVRLLTAIGAWSTCWVLAQTGTCFGKMPLVATYLGCARQPQIPIQAPTTVASTRPFIGLNEVTPYHPDFSVHSAIPTSADCVTPRLVPIPRRPRICSPICGAR